MNRASAADERVVETTVDGVARPPWSRGIAAFCGHALREAGASAWEISVLLCGDERMKALNSRYGGKNSTTDVLSFPRKDARSSSSPHALAGGLVAGDIAISIPAMRRNAKEFGNSEDEELKRLLVHGILHLAGMDHGAGKGRAMLALQGRLLAALQTRRIIPGGSSGE